MNDRLLSTLRKLLSREALLQQPLPFLDEHPLIRPLDDYGRIVAAALKRQEDRSSMSEGFLRHDSGVPWLQKEKDPGSANCRGLASSGTRPRSGYPLPGCASAEPGSVSPDSSSVVPPSSFHQEQRDA